MKGVSFKTCQPFKNELIFALTKDSKHLKHQLNLTFHSAQYTLVSVS